MSLALDQIAMTVPRWTEERRRAFPEELVDGDLLLIDRRRLLVEGEPLISHSGWSLFDDFEMFFQVRVKSLDGGDQELLRLRPAQPVEILGRVER